VTMRTFTLAFKAMALYLNHSSYPSMGNVHHRENGNATDLYQFLSFRINADKEASNKLNSTTCGMKQNCASAHEAA